MTSRTLQLLAALLRREARITWLIFLKELRELLVSRALWAMVLISAPLVGFSFIQAVRLYSDSSSNALRLPQLAANINPLDGIIIPTFGAVYLMNTFLLPFVAIRAIGNEKQSGALKIALQLPIGVNRLVTVKLAALAIGWCIALLPTLSALGIWALLLGGHLYVPELLTVVLGHALYALVIAGAAFLAASITESSATGSIVALAFTLGSWILEFAGSTNSGLLRAIAQFSLSPALRGLEHGLLGSPTALTLLVLGLGFLALSVVWLPPGVSRRQKLVRSGAVFGVAAQALLLVIQLPIYVDVSENQRNSFNPADMRALHQMSKELKVSVNLASNDSRLADLDRNVLSKLPRVMPHVTIVYAEVSTSGLLGGASGANYGLVTYTYGGKQGVTRATTAREVLPLIEALDGRSVTPDPVPLYPGFPLVTSADGAAVWFYALLPLLALAGWWYAQQPPPEPQAAHELDTDWSVLRRRRGWDVPSQGTNVPSQGTNVPSQGTNVPSRASIAPSHGANVASDAGYVLSHGPNVPSHGPNVPSRGVNVPSRGVNAPSHGPNVPSRGVNVPSRGVNVPSHGGVGASRRRRRRWTTAVAGLRTVVLTIAAAFIAIQLVPYGRSHTNFIASAPVSAVSERFCPPTFSPGSESTMPLGVFRTQLSMMIGQLDAAATASDANALRAQYSQFATAYSGVGREIAELYPTRCRRLIADRLEGDAAILMGSDANTGARSVAALRAGLASISTDLNQRIQQASPDALVGTAAQIVDVPTVTGVPMWDSPQTAALTARACGGCHGNQPGWSWYSNLAPLSWLVQHDVDLGRRVLNFSEWDMPQPGAGDVVSSVEQGRMPPPYAGLINSDLRLTPAERAQLASGLAATLRGPAYAAVPANEGQQRGSAVLVATLGTLLVAIGFVVGRWRGYWAVSTPAIGEALSSGRRISP